MPVNANNTWKAWINETPLELEKQISDKQTQIDESNYDINMGLQDLSTLKFIYWNQLNRELENQYYQTVYTGIAVPEDQYNENKVTNDFNTILKSKSSQLYNSLPHNAQDKLIDDLGYYVVWNLIDISDDQLHGIARYVELLSYNSQINNQTLMDLQNIRLYQNNIPNQFDQKYLSYCYHWVKQFTEILNIIRVETARWYLDQANDKQMATQLVNTYHD